MYKDLLAHLCCPKLPVHDGSSCSSKQLVVQLTSWRGWCGEVHTALTLSQQRRHLQQRQQQQPPAVTVLLPYRLLDTHAAATHALSDRASAFDIHRIHPSVSLATRSLARRPSCCLEQSNYGRVGSHKRSIGAAACKPACTQSPLVLLPGTHHSRPSACCCIRRQLHRGLHISCVCGQCCCHVTTPTLDQTPQHAARHIAGIKCFQQRLHALSTPTHTGMSRVCRNRTGVGKRG